MRRFSFTVLLVAICLLPVGIGSGASAHSHAVAALDGALGNTASAQGQVLEDYFSRARSIDLLTANNPAFQDFYALLGSRAAKVRRGGPVLDKANEALGYLEELFPDSIGGPASSTGLGLRTPAWSAASGPPWRTCPPMSRAPRSSRPHSPFATGRSTRPGPMCRPTPRNG
jgi:hypothetical protein